MAKHLPFQSAEFRYLFALIENKLGRKIDKDSTISAFFGYGTNYDPYPYAQRIEPTGTARASLKFAMLDDSEVWKYLESIPGWWSDYKRTDDDNPDTKELSRKNYFNGQQLQKKYDLIFKKNATQITITDTPYAIAYIIYAGICTADDGKKGLAFQKFKEAFSTRQYKQVASPEPVKTEEGESIFKKTEYVCYYYSYTAKGQERVKSFNLTIDYSRKISYDPSLPNYQGYYAEETNFHDFDRSKRIFTGFAYEMSVGSKLHVSLTEKKDRLAIIFNAGLEPQKKDFMLGAILGSSTVDPLPPLSMVLIAVRNDPELLTEKNLIYIRRYLNLSRRSFVVDTDYPERIEDLRHRGIRVKRLDYLCGHHRLLRFDETYSEIIESHFYIDDFFNALCTTKQFTDDEFNRQIALLKINQDPGIGDSIFISTYSSGIRLTDSKIIANILLKFIIPGMDKKEDIISDGVIIVRGRHENMLLKRSIIFQKVKSSEDVNIGSHPIKTLLKRASHDPLFKKALSRLIELETFDTKNIVQNYQKVKSELSNLFPALLNEL